MKPLRALLIGFCLFALVALWWVRSQSWQTEVLKQCAADALHALKGQ